MSQPSAAPVTIDQVAFWSGEGGQRWLAGECYFDSAIAQFGAAALAAAAPRQGERALDIGCGTGRTTLDLARTVAPSGAVIGVDVSPLLLAEARRRAAAAAAGHVTFVEANAQTHPFAPGQFDLVFSRFGVMFFHDSAAAFDNIRRAMRSSGRMIFLCWRRLEDNPWAAIPFAAARPHLPPVPTPGPEDPGPYSFADPDRVQRILKAAAWSDVSLERLDAPVALAAAGGLDEALRFVSCLGPAGRALAGASEPQRARAVCAIGEALEPHVGPSGAVSLMGSCWIVRARAPAVP
jgi:SAM-dependent methyltransferase